MGCRSGWLEADLCFGSGRNEAFLFSAAWRCAMDDDCSKLFELSEQAAPFAKYGPTAS
jgi:urease accessory protein